MFEGLLMNDLCNSVTMIGIKNIFNHMVLKDCYEAGLISEDAWKSYLKGLISETTKEDKNGE